MADDQLQQLKQFIESTVAGSESRMLDEVRTTALESEGRMLRAIQAAVTESERRMVYAIESSVAASEARLGKKIDDGFAGVGDTIDGLLHEIEIREAAANKRLLRLERRAA